MGRQSISFTPPIAPDQSSVEFRVFVDACSIELFVDDGELVISDCVFPSGRLSYACVAQQGSVRFGELTVWPLQSIR